MNEYRLADVFVGLSHSFHVDLNTQMMEQFKKMSGDINPLHTDTAFAVSYGYRDRVSYGMLTASFYSTLIGVYLPGRYALLQGVDASFVAPVFPGDKLFVYGEITSIHRVLRQIEIKAYVSDACGKKISKAKIRVGVNE